MVTSRVGAAKVGHRNAVALRATTTVLPGLTAGSRGALKIARPPNRRNVHYNTLCVAVLLRDTSTFTLTVQVERSGREGRSKVGCWLRHGRNPRALI